MKPIKRIIFWSLLSLHLCILLTLTAQQDTRESNLPDPETIYKLRSGDTIKISVYDEPDLSVTQKLDPNGVVIVPLLGRTNLDGLTLREAEQTLEGLFISEEYLIRPQVTVGIANYADQVFYIFGEVNQPGAKSFPEGRQKLDILEAITLGGDLSQYAKRSEIVIRRPVKGDNREEKILVNLDEVIRGNRRGNEELVLIYPEDIIFVPERIF